MSKNHFQMAWKADFPWVKEGPQKGYATCTLCKKDTIYFSSMGRSALTSHSKSQKHIFNEKNSSKYVPIKSFFSSSTKKCDSVDPSPSTSKEQLSFPNIESVPLASRDPQSTSNEGIVLKNEKWWKAKDEVSECEVLWCLQTVMCHNSLRSAESCVHLFKRMFKDSSIAGDMRLGKDKIAYSIIHGIAPYLKQQLVSIINKSDFFVLCFDESLNKFSQKQQMDLVVRYWDEDRMQVATNYFNSVFLNKSTSLDLLDGIKQGLAGLDLKKMVQLSMDGPNVNHKLLRLLKEELFGKQMLDIGSCGLHVLNVAFKTGMKATNWELMSFFRSLYYLFKDSPSRRGTFIAATDSSNFPLKFCQVRWLENSNVANRALEIFENVNKFVEYVKTNKIRQISSSSSFKKVSASLEDNLLRPKIAFFTAVADDLEPFLREFQSNSPMAPFLFSSLIGVLKKCMGRFVKEDVMLNTPLQQIDLKEENLKGYKEVDLGYATRAAIRVSKVKEIDILHFRKDCKSCLKALTAKILEKCPLKYPMTEAISFLDPQKVLFRPDEAIKQMTCAMDLLVSSSFIQASRAQEADRQFREVICKDQTKLLLEHYSRDQRLDDFWMSVLRATQDAQHLKYVLSILMPLSHGNASVERGFSVNGDIIIENLKEESLTAQRLVYDKISSSGGIDNFIITKELLLFVRNSNARWKEALANKREKLSEEEKAKIEKRKATKLANELKEKRKKLLEESHRAMDEIDNKIKQLETHKQIAD